MLGIRLLPGSAIRASTSSLASAVPDIPHPTAIARAEAEAFAQVLRDIMSVILLSDPSLLLLVCDLYRLLIGHPFGCHGFYFRTSIDRAHRLDRYLRDSSESFEGNVTAAAGIAVARLALS